MPPRAPRGARTIPNVPSPDALIDRSLAAAWLRELAALEAASREGEESWDAKWEAVDAILSHDPPLYLAASLRTEKAFRERYLPGVSQDVMRDNALVARYFDADAQSRFGTSTLALLVRYLARRNGGALPPLKIDPARTKVRVRRGSVVEEALFPTLSYDEMRRALRGSGATGTRRESEAVAEIRAQLRRRRVEDVGVRERAGRFDLLGVTPEMFPRLARALDDVRWP